MNQTNKRRLCIAFGVIAIIVIALAFAPHIAFAQTENSISPQADFSKYFSGGNGSEADPYLITNQAELNNIRYTVEYDEDDGDSCYKSFKLVNDIRITTREWLPVEGAFWGTFDGNNKTIYNMKLVRGKNTECGFMEYNYGEIKDLNFDGAAISNSESSVTANFGIVAGVNHGLITNCKVTNSNVAVTSYNANVGGIAGCTYAGRVFLCDSSAVITGSGNIGGIVGLSYGGNIHESINRGTITYLYNTQNGCAAGIVGKAIKSTILKKCINFGNIVYGSPKKSGDSSIFPCMAQIVGWLQEGTTTDCSMNANTDYSNLYKGLFVNQLVYCSTGEIGRRGQ